MAKCDYCNSTILLGGTKQGDLRFCNTKCYQDGFLLTASRQISPEIVKQHVDQLHQGACPHCKGPGPVDVHTSYQVYSVLVLTRWSTRPKICCRSCGVKSQLTDTLISALFGWWGLPWGLIFTPVQVTRNLIGIFTGSKRAQSSPQLEKFVRLQIAAQLVSKNKAGLNKAPALGTIAPPPLPVPIPSEELYQDDDRYKPAAERRLAP